MKKKLVVIAIAIFSFFVIGALALFFVYKNNLKAVDSGKDIQDVVFVVEQGMTTKDVIDSLYDVGLIKNKYVGYAYIKIHNNYVLKAGVYDLDTGMDLKELLEKIKSGAARDDSISVTFVEGKRMTYFVSQISKNFGYSEDEIYAVIQNKEYLNKLIDKYWFLTDEILNDKLYYALEGYLSPNTYYFNKDATIEEIIEKLLDTTGFELNKHKDAIEKSDFTVHEFLTLASIVELEGGNADDRQGVAGVFYNRLNSGWSLGSDVTTYYGARVDMAERDLTIDEINEINAYNTRVAQMAGKLPVGPICNPGIDAIVATIEPKEHDYYYFVADKNGKTYFTKSQAEHDSKIAELKRNGLWFEY